MAEQNTKVTSGARLLVPQATDMPDSSKTVNLKYIGAAFDLTIDELQAVKQRAKNPAEVEETITKLQNLRREVAVNCPQMWFALFD